MLLNCDPFLEAVPDVSWKHGVLGEAPSIDPRGVKLNGGVEQYSSWIGISDTPFLKDREFNEDIQVWEEDFLITIFAIFLPQRSAMSVQIFYLELGQKSAVEVEE